MNKLLAAVAVVTLSACPNGAGKKDARGASAPLAQIARLEQERVAPSTLAPFLADSDAAVRERAVLALARLEHRATLEPLLSSSRDADASVRAMAAFGLGQLDLAIDAKNPAHEETRAAAEARLVEMLKDGDAGVRLASVRALGRIADKAGLDALIGMAGQPGGGQAPALQALGVSGARRQASRKSDPALLSAVSSALASSDEHVRAGAAYAAFRQRLQLDGPTVKAALTQRDAQTRIFLMRAAGVQDGAATELIEAGLADNDWRVRVEALRAAAAKKGPVASIARVLEDASALVHNDPNSAGGGHVVREACAALVATEAGPAEIGGRLVDATMKLIRKPELRPVACACAVASDVVSPDKNLVSRCTQDEALLARLEVQKTAGSRMSSRERVGALAHFLLHDDTKVRMAAAAALAEEANDDAAAAAVKALQEEADYGVVTALLELFGAEEKHAALPDSTLYKILERHRTGPAYEHVEPLVTVAKIARTRQTPTARAIVAELEGHTEPRVRDAATGTAAGDREPGPRASVVAAPSAAELPASATLKTTRGNIKIKFEREIAPATVSNFVALAKAKYYDGTPFHRVIADFVAQGGDRRGDGSGGPGYNVPCENSDAPYVRGAVGMAHAGKDTGGSQFFLTHSWQPHLDGRYTLFGHVAEGIDVMDAIQPDDTLISVDIQ